MVMKLIKMACKIRATYRSLFAARRTGNSKICLAMQSQCNKTPLSKEAFVAHLTSKKSRCASSKGPFPIEKGAVELLCQQSLSFSVVFKTSTTLSCVAPTDDDMCWHVCNCWTGRMYSSSKLLLTEFGSLVNAEHWLLPVCKTRVGEMTIWMVKWPTIHTCAAKVGNVFTDWTKCCYRRSVQPLHCCVHLQLSWSLRFAVMKHICFMIINGSSFAAGAFKIRQCVGKGKFARWRKSGEVLLLRCMIFIMYKRTIWKSDVCVIDNCSCE